MKKMLYAIAALLAAAACSQQPEHQAQALLDEARTALEQNEYQTALALVDSLSRTYPKAFDQRHEALKLKQEAALKQAQQELAAVDSMLEAVKRRHDAQHQYVMEHATTLKDDAPEVLELNRLRLQRDSLQVAFDALCGKIKYIHRKQEQQAEDASQQEKR